jgi:hypothetical protein
MIIIDYICIICIFTPPDRLARRWWICSKGHIASVEWAARSGFGEFPWALGVSEIGIMCVKQWIGLRENLQESPIFNGKIYGFL